MSRNLQLILLACALISCSPSRASPHRLIKSKHPRESPPFPQSSDPSHWTTIARRDLKAATDVLNQRTDYRAKNAILFLGDGMGITSVTAGRILKGQLVGQSGEEATLEFERFPHTGLSKTYNTDMQTPDSAGTGTAFMCGVKAKSGTIGLNELVQAGDCASQLRDRYVDSFITDALKSGKSVGIVTTTRITHATPAAAYAHTASRDWEDDTDRNRDVPDESIRWMCPDIAEQLIDNAINFTVIFGGGRQKFLLNNESTIDPITGKPVKGTRTSANLIERWKQRQTSFGRHPVYMETKEEFLKATYEPNARYFGLFATKHLQYDFDNQKNPKEPTIEEMTRKAIEILSRNPKGFALQVEGGRIDHAHHDNLAKKSMHDLVAFDKAIKAAGELTNSNETLTVVTADHGHVFTVGAYGSRGQPLFGKIQSRGGSSNTNGEALAGDGLPYQPVAYADGPSAVVNGGRKNITDVDTEAADYRAQSLVRKSSESHSAEDVGIYAKGPGSHLFHATHEQHYIAHVFKHSLCVGDYASENYCLAEWTPPTEAPKSTDPPKSGSVLASSPVLIALLIAVRKIAFC